MQRDTNGRDAAEFGSGAGLAISAISAAQPQTAASSDEPPTADQHEELQLVHEDDSEAVLEAEYAEERWAAVEEELNNELPFADGSSDDEDDAYYFILSRCAASMYCPTQTCVRRSSTHGLTYGSGCGMLSFPRSTAAQARTRRRHLPGATGWLDAQIVFCFLAA